MNDKKIEEFILERLNFFKKNQDYGKRSNQFEYNHFCYKINQTITKLVNEDYANLTIAIKTPNPIGDHFWGDYFFAKGLKKQFEKKGLNVLIHERQNWYNDENQVDIVLVLRGLVRYNPKQEHINIMWNISHPDLITNEEYSDFDIVFICSETYANKISNKINTIVKPLLQCTDPEVFYNQYNPDFTNEILFVGSTRGVFRKIIQDISQTSHPFSVYGPNWEKFIDEKHHKGNFIDNDKLNQAYSSCKILLNDHWEDMLKNDFPSNRLFDALACGTFVISDEIPSAATIFQGTVITYSDSKDLDKKISYYLKNNHERIEKAKKGQKLVLENHTFQNRVETILETLKLLKNLNLSFNMIDSLFENYNFLKIMYYEDYNTLYNEIKLLKDKNKKLLTEKKYTKN